MALFLAHRDGRDVGRISAQIDRLQHTLPPEQGMGPGTGNWGMFEAQDADNAAALIGAAEEWLRAKGMTRVLAPLSLSIWDEPGLLVRGHDHPPTIIVITSYSIHYTKLYEPSARIASWPTNRSRPADSIPDHRLMICCWPRSAPAPR